MEYSDKTAENTRWVEVWINNDEEHYFAAQDFARQGAVQLGAFLTGVLQNARPESAAWYTARELSANDYDRIDWAEIAATLLDE